MQNNIPKLIWRVSVKSSQVLQRSDRDPFFVSMSVFFLKKRRVRLKALSECPFSKRDVNPRISEKIQDN